MSHLRFSLSLSLSQTYRPTLSSRTRRRDPEFLSAFCRQPYPTSNAHIFLFLLRRTPPPHSSERLLSTRASSFSPSKNSYLGRTSFGFSLFPIAGESSPLVVAEKWVVGGQRLAVDHRAPSRYHHLFHLESSAPPFFFLVAVAPLFSLSLSLSLSIFVSLRPPRVFCGFAASRAKKKTLRNWRRRQRWRGVLAEMMDLAAVSPAAERARRCQEYLEALEEERRKIEVFQRELPLSLHIVTQAVESYRQQMAAEMLGVGCAVPSEREGEAVEISSEAPVLEEFIPIKRCSSSEADDEEEPGDRRLHDHQHSGNGGHNDEDSSSTGRQKLQERTSENVPDWLRSVQLWSQQPDSPPLPREEKHTLHVDSVALEPKKSTGAFHPFQPQKRSPPPPPPVEAAPVPAPAPTAPVTSSNSETRGGGVGSDDGGGGKSGCSNGNEKDGHPHRKSRRCWSPELHRRFLNALQQLGGSDVGTPKRIRELMKVDGLTNDEVKSHLQKYRLHSRRPSPTSHANSGSAPPQQVVFVGGIWVPPPEYAAAAVAAAATEGNPPCPPAEIYAPVASVPAPKQQQQQQRSSRGRDEQCVADDGAIPSDDYPATSSSSRTNTSGLAVRRR